EMIRTFIANGADGHAFDPIVASGANSCTLHYTKNNAVMHSGDLLLLDFGSEYNGYAADMSRTLPVSGSFTPRQRELYQAVLDAQKAAIGLIKPGVTIKEINKATERFLEQRMVDLNLLKQTEIDNQPEDAPLYKKYFMHGTCHFMGLDVHDVGDTAAVLEPGMILTCEPGIYISEEQIGVRIENDILVTESGAHDLMERVPREANEMERQ
nr:M24 family metallopeptidase [Salinivirgaceae bacterium]